MTTSSSYTISRLRPEHVDDGLRLCRAAGWNQIDRDWRFFLKHSADDSFVALRRGQVVGTATVTTYAERLAWIGMVLVDPSHRRQGIGSGLLGHLMEHVGESCALALDATPAGREVYLPLGFQDVSTIVRLAGKVRGDARPDTAARKMSGKELAEIVEFDQVALGCKRLEILHWWLEGTPGYAWVVREAGQLLGYCLGRAGQTHDQLGPLVAIDSMVARALSQAVFENAARRDWIIDVPAIQFEWIAWLKEQGFAEQRVLYRMVRGALPTMASPERVFAIVAPEVG